jgi:adenosylmethionine-8-amino-7-oxononanoate aminotransferase
MSPAAILTQSDDFSVKSIAMEQDVDGYLMDRDLNSAAHEVVSAKGNYIELSNGQTVFDATGGAAVSCHGHGNEEIIAAVAKQMREISYCHSMFFKTRATDALAEALIAGTDYRLAKAFIICSGKSLAL